MKECFWEKFTQTGRVEDYLSYKGMEICQDVIEKHKENASLVILDGVEDVHNIGAIIRTCVCAGIKGVLIPLFSK